MYSTIPTHFNFLELSIEGNLNAMATLEIVDISQKPQPKFKRYFTKFLEVDPLSAFSHIPLGVLHTKDIRDYIHGNMEEKSYVKVFNLWVDELVKEYYNLKPKCNILTEKKLDV